jgi:hypothetical protein
MDKLCNITGLIARLDDWYASILREGCNNGGDRQALAVNDIL